MILFLCAWLGCVGMFLVGLDKDDFVSDHRRAAIFRSDQAWMSSSFHRGWIKSGNKSKLDNSTWLSAMDLS